MIWAKVALYGLAVGWALLVVTWPSNSNVAPIHEGNKSGATDEGVAGEGLYKASLTNANFGLLGVKFYESSENKKHWNINSRFAELHRKENYAFMQGVTAEFYAQKTGNVIFTKSDYGRSQVDKQIVDLEGNVSIRSKRGYLFQMEKLNYNGTKNEFTTDEPIHMKGPVVEQPTMLLRGVGLLADIDSEYFHVKKNVTAQRKLKNSEWLRITSRSGDFFTDEQRAVFHGKARSVLPTMTIDCDEFEVSAVKESEFMQARGNVVLKHKDRIGHAETAFIEVGTNKMILEGKARIDAKDNQITGRRITLYSNDDRVEVEQAEGKVAN